VEWNRKNIWYLLGIIFAGIAFYVGLQHLDVIGGVFSSALSLLSPFFVGGAIAFVLNVPMRAIEGRLPFRGGRAAALRRPLAYLLTLACVAGVLALASLVIVPNVGEAVTGLAAQLPETVQSVQQWLQNLSEQTPAFGQAISRLNIDWESLMQKMPELLQSAGDRLLSSGAAFLSGLLGRLFNFFIGFVFSIYILMQKEKLGRQGRQCLYALLPERAGDRCMDILALSARTFSSFLSGQCLEACILGSLFVVSMAVFRMPYALLVGVLIALTALIPIVGAFIGCAVGFLLIAISDPWQALMFVVLFLVLQQVEGNLIYPHVVGSSVGLPSIWVLAAVTVGGKLFGVAGMLVFIPLCSVLYALFRGFVFRRLRRRNVPAEKWEQAPAMPDRPHRLKKKTGA